MPLAPNAHVNTRFTTDTAKIALRHLAADALSVQDACNPVPLAGNLQRAYLELNHIAFDLKEGGTRWVAEHPIVLALLDKLASLGGTNLESCGHYIRCKDIAEGKETGLPGDTPPSAETLALAAEEVGPVPEAPLTEK